MDNKTISVDPVPCNGTNISNCASENELDHSGLATLVTYIRITVPVLFSLIILIGFVGNILVIVCIFFNQSMRNTTNLLIINLAMADLLFIVLCVPSTAFDYAMPMQWPFGNIWCKIVQYLLFVTAYASVYTLVLMSSDRFFAVVYPIESIAFRTERNCNLAISVMWIAILVSCSPLLISHGERITPRINSSQTVECMFLKEEWSYSTFQISFFITSYIIPLSLVCVLYMFVLKRLWFGANPGGHESAQMLRVRREVTKMVTSVIVIFAVSWAPIQIILLLKSLGLYHSSTATTISLQVIGQVLAYMNSCVNPFIYAFCSENFRKSFKKIILCCNKQKMNNKRLQNGRDKNYISVKDRNQDKETCATML